MGSRKQSSVGDQDELRSLRERVAQLDQVIAQLTSSEERLQILFEHAPDAYYLSDLKGTFVDGNAAAERITGYKKGELIGKSFLKLKLLSAGDLPKVTSLLARNVLGRSTGPDELTLIRKDGTPVVVEIRTHPVRIGGRRLVLGIARDISARKRAEAAQQESEERFRDLIEHSHDLIQSVDPDGRFQYVNNAWLKALGYKKSEIRSSHPARRPTPGQPRPLHGGLPVGAGRKDGRSCGRGIHLESRRPDPSGGERELSIQGRATVLHPWHLSRRHGT